MMLVIKFSFSGASLPLNATERDLFHQLLNNTAGKCNFIETICIHHHHAPKSYIWTHAAWWQNAPTEMLFCNCLPLLQEICTLGRLNSYQDNNTTLTSYLYMHYKIIFIPNQRYFQSVEVNVVFCLEVQMPKKRTEQLTN